MVKSVVGEETQLKLIENQSNHHHHHQVEVGLVIGKLSSTLDRAFVFQVIPTPNNDAGQPPCSIQNQNQNQNNKKKKNSNSDNVIVNVNKQQRSSSSSKSSSSSLLIDTDWVSEHARQVSRLLLGGFYVIGLYVSLNDTALFNNSTLLLSQTLHALAQAAASIPNIHDRLLLHFSHAPIRWTCRICTLSSHITSTNLRPCDFKMASLLNSLHSYTCFYNFHIRFPVYLANPSKHQTFSHLLRHGISSHLNHLQGALVLIDGKPVVEEETCTSDGLHQVEFLLPFMNDTFADDFASQKDVAGVLVFRGSICSFTFMHPKEPISQVLTDIRDDISSSLQSRLDIICDEAEGELHSTLDGDNDQSGDITTGKPAPQLVLQLLRKHCNISFPRRVFIPWLPGTFICDYLQQAETLEVLKDHCVELMSMEAPIDVSTILELETEAPTLTTTRSFWEVSNPCFDPHISDAVKSDSRRKENIQKPFKSIINNISIKTSVFFLLLSIIVGLVLLLLTKGS